MPTVFRSAAITGFSLLLIPLVTLGSGCTKSEPEPAPKPAVEPAAEIPLRSAESAARSPRMGPANLWATPASSGAGGLVPEPPDDPTLNEDYYDGEAEHDGGQVAVAAPRPRPTNLPGNRSFSIGPPNGGWLINGKAMPVRGSAHRVLPWTWKRGYYWGSDDLVRLIQQAALDVNRKHPGAVLRVGNLSGQRGGKITPSVSHQSGRDVDLGLYVLNLDGEPVDAAGFPKFKDGAKVDTTRRYLFDEARNWALVETFLTDERAQVQWLFLDTPLKERLLDYAVRSRVDARVIDKAEKVIVRPRDSSPHANHFHIRIFCSDADTEYGCRDYGPEWKWVKESRRIDAQLLDERVERIMSGEEPLDLSDGDLTLPTAAGIQEPKAMSPDQLPDPPISVQIKL
jgi:penicillin-insensitive murein endopeptidase